MSNGLAGPRGKWCWIQGSVFIFVVSKLDFHRGCRQSSHGEWGSLLLSPRLTSITPTHDYFSMRAGGGGKCAGGKGQMMPVEWAFLLADVGVLFWATHANTLIWRDLLTPLYLCCTLSHLIISKSLPIQPNSQLLWINIVSIPLAQCEKGEARETGRSPWL